MKNVKKEIDVEYFPKYFGINTNILNNTINKVEVKIENVVEVTSNDYLIFLIKGVNFLNQKVALSNGTTKVKETLNKVEINFFEFLIFTVFTVLHV